MTVVEAGLKAGTFNTSVLSLTVNVDRVMSLY